MYNRLYVAYPRDFHFMLIAGRATVNDLGAASSYSQSQNFRPGLAGSSSRGAEEILMLLDSCPEGCSIQHIRASIPRLPEQPSCDIASGDKEADGSVSDPEHVAAAKHQFRSLLNQNCAQIYFWVCNYDIT